MHVYCKDCTYLRYVRVPPTKVSLRFFFFANSYFFLVNLYARKEHKKEAGRHQGREGGRRRGGGEGPLLEPPYVLYCTVPTTNSMLPYCFLSNHQHERGKERELTYLHLGKTCHPIFLMCTTTMLDIVHIMYSNNMYSTCWFV